MPATVGINKMTVIHSASNGMTIAFPDVCLTPGPPAPPLPIPYPNIAMSTDTAKGAKTVSADGNPVCNADSNFSRSSGDEAGVNNGVASAKCMGKAEFVNYSFDVKIEGKGATRAMDLMLHNDKNTPPSPVIQPPLMTVALEEPEEPEEEPGEWALEAIEVS